MSRAVGDIAIQLHADISPFERNMDRAGRSVQQFEARGARMGASLVAVGARVAAAGAAMVAAVGAVSVAGAGTARELQNMARVSNTSVENFQQLAYAARSVGIEGDKLADIFRDVQDRVGDFLSTGGGPMADFFENIAPLVGVTADAFAQLSGPDALQLYVDSLEAANLSQSEMTFYLEAMASDASDLLPLLRANGQEMAALAAEASNLGTVLDSETVARAAEAQESFDQMTATLSTAAVEIAGTLAPAIEGLARILVTLVRGLDTAATAVANFLDPQSDLQIATDNLVAAMGDEIQQSELLARALGTSNSMSEQAARNALAEAQARYQNVQAIIEERRALALGSTEFASLSEGIENAQGNLARLAAPGADAGQIPRQLADAYEEQERTLVRLLQRRQELLATDAEMEGQAARTLENMEALEEALSRASGGVVTFGDPVTPIDPSERQDLGGGGGGGYGQTDLESLLESFMTEQEMLQENYERQLEMLREFREQRLITEEEYNDLERQLTERHQRELTDAENTAQRQRIGQISGALGEMASIIESYGNSNLEIVRGLKIAEAIISGYQAAVDAWQRGMQAGGPALAAAYTAMSVARTGGLIAQMSSAGKGGTSGGGVGAASAATAAPAPLEARLVGLDPNALYSGAQIDELLDQLMDAAGDRGLSLTTVAA